MSLPSIPVIAFPSITVISLPSIIVVYLQCICDAPPSSPSSSHVITTVPRPSPLIVTVWFATMVPLIIVPGMQSPSEQGSTGCLSVALGKYDSSVLNISCFIMKLP